MKSKKLLISLPAPLRDTLEAEKQRGVTASGLIRHLLEQYFKPKRRQHRVEGRANRSRAAAA